jgi:outer membrane protein TolC
MRHHIFKIAILLFSLSFSMQLMGQRDSVYQLSVEEMLQMVRSNHPIALQANLKIDNAESFERSAKGGFDPKLEADFNNKFYKETNYYSNTHGAIKIPTRSPISFKAGYDLNDGKFLDPSNSTPDDGLFQAGISLPILQGLITDERRTQLKVAEAFTQYSEAEKKALYNQLMFEAYGAYWNWWNAFERTNVAEELIEIATNRFEAIKQRAIAGDRPFIDTVEAYLQQQLRQQQLVEAMILEVKSRYYLSGFLWNDNQGQPEGLIISEKAIPQNPTGIEPLELNEYRLASFTEIVNQSHPEIAAYDAKINQLEAEAKWKQEKVKPKLNLEYNMLSTGINSASDNGFSTSNYKWGMTFSVPIFLREARGEVQMARIKIQDSEYSRDLKTNDLINKASASYENLSLIREQLKIAESNLNNYNQLLNAERERFFNGESSLFLVNQREMAYADAKNKVLDLKSKLEMSGIEVLYTLGQLR